MARIDRSLRLDERTIETLMRSESRLRIATLGRDDKINLTPMTFGWAGGLVYIFARGQKIANLRRNPSATVLVDVGEAWRELQGIMMQGSARVLETVQDEQADPFLKEAQLDLGRKHSLEKDGERVPYRATAAGRSRRWIVFAPDSVVTWDNSKLPTGSVPSRND